MARCPERKLHLYAWLCLALWFVHAPTRAQPEPWPAKPIRLIVPYPAGGPTDITARLITPRMSEVFGRPIVIENRGGAATLIGTEIVARAPPDGHTLLLVTSTISINPSTYKQLPYDTMRDLVPVTVVISTPFTMITHPTVPARTPQALVKLAKAQPGHLLHPSSGIGSSSHLAIALLARETGIEVTHVPYKGTAQWQADLMAGHLHFALTNPVGSLPLAKGGKVRLLATTGAQRLAIMPDVPTVAETIARGYEAGNWHALFAPAGTPREIVERLHGEVMKSLAVPAIRQKFLDGGAHVSGMPPDAFAKFFRSEVEKWARAVKVAGVKIE